jgi:tRNA dimethylallyltransferase
MEGVPHYLLDIIDDCSQFNASIFLEKSFELSEDIVSRGKIPITCGGTALYLKTMIRGIFPEDKEKKVSREELNELVDQKGLPHLFQQLKEVDPAYAEKIRENDRIRIVRGMEIYLNNGIPPSEIFKQTRSPFEDYSFIRIGLNMERAEIYRRIEKRVDRMMDRGLVDEVRWLRGKYPDWCPPFKSLGYKEVIQVLNGQSTMDAAVALIKQRSRNFAKRQLSWFRQEKDIHWFNPRQIDKIHGLVKKELWNDQ